MKSILDTIWLSAGLAAVVIACGSSPKPAGDTPITTDTTDTTDTAKTTDTTDTAKTTDDGDIGEGIAFADKSHDQKKAFMKKRMVPAIEAIWGESPEPDEEVKCTLCHGDSAKEGDFEMPNDDLPKLDPSDEFMGHGDAKDWLAFMSKKMVPTVADTLGVKPYDPKTHEGFGCFACHPMAD